MVSSVRRGPARAAAAGRRPAPTLARKNRRVHELARRIGLPGAVWIGLGSMIGAGIFAAPAPATAAAGSAVLVALALAAVVACCNATSSAQLAAAYPRSGGSYLYGRELLGPWPGFLAGWCFVIGKTGSTIAMALIFAAYLVPQGWQRPAACAAILVLGGINCAGITRTLRATMIIVSAVLVVLVTAIVVGLRAPVAAGGWFGVPPAEPSALGILQGAGLLFFAFAGYARIATLGEEVRDPRRVIGRAVVITLGVVLTLYLVVLLVLLRGLGVPALAASTAPLADLVAAAGASWLVPAIGIGAALASLGALLALQAGIGRTALAMARNDDLPRWLAAIGARGVPTRAIAVPTVIAAGLVWFVPLGAVIGFSSFGVLLYYLVANLAALRQAGDDRRFPRVLQVTGAALCVLLVATVGPASLIVGAAMVCAGIGWRVVARVSR